jgi:hypothetical protein
MRAQVLAVATIVGLVLGGARRATAQAAEATGLGGPAAQTLSVSVPAFVRFSIAEGQAAPDGTPIVRVVTNDPTIRRMASGGVAREELQALSVRFSGVQHSKGGELAMEGGAQVTTQVVRYTIVRP